MSLFVLAVAVSCSAVLICAALVRPATASSVTSTVAGRVMHRRVVRIYAGLRAESAASFAISATHLTGSSAIPIQVIANVACISCRTWSRAACKPRVEPFRLGEKKSSVTLARRAPSSVQVRRGAAPARAVPTRHASDIPKTSSQIGSLTEYSPRVIILPK